MRLSNIPRGVRRPLVVDPHRPDDLRSEGGRDRLDQIPQPGVRRRLGLVRQVTGERDHVGRRGQPPESREGEHEAGLGVDRVVLPGAAGEQVRVAQVGDRVTGRRVLTELDHAPDCRPPRQAQPSCSGRCLLQTVAAAR